MAIGFAGGLFVVPLNAWLQEKAGVHEKGRILATNNFANMAGVIAASGALYLLHDVLRWSPSAIFIALGIAVLIGAAAAVAVIPGISVRFVLWCLSKMLVRACVEGAEYVPRTGAALLVSNHVSYADSVLVGLTTPRIVRFLVWAPFYRIKATQWFFKAFHAIPVHGGSARTIIPALQAARAELLKGKLVGIFAEGGVTRSGNVEPFTRGFGRIVEGTGAPIIPMHIEGMFGHPLSYKNGGLGRSWDRVWWPRVTVRVGPPIYGEISPEDLRKVVLSLGGIHEQEPVSWK
jgi:acyl-[acyl-carrier-protein]-phospholipid O-acyltransferase/long-chain-fatty-acid--[acyl-carrier-protein] ligase